MKGEKPPTPTRKIAGDEDDDDDEKDVQGDESENDEVDGGGGAGGGGGGFNPEDLVDRKNIRFVYCIPALSVFIQETSHISM